MSASHPFRVERVRANGDGAPVGNKRTRAGADSLAAALERLNDEGSAYRVVDEREEPTP